MNPFSHKGKHYAIPADVPYRGYQLKELTLVPRPVNLPVECWQPIVSASTRGIEFMLRHGIRGLVGGGAATMAEGPIQAYQRVANSMGRNLKLGEGLAIGVSFYLAKTREQAIHLVTAILREGTAQGAYTIPDPDMTALLLLGGVRAVIRFGKRPRPRDLPRPEYKALERVH